MRSRGDLQVADAAQINLFSTTRACPELQDILVSNPDPKSQLGNFTEKPTSSLLQTCSRMHAVYLLDGSKLPEVFSQPTPEVKVCLGPIASSLLLAL
jgi:hypothetical protein